MSTLQSSSLFARVKPFVCAHARLLTGSTGTYLHTHLAGFAGGEEAGGRDGMCVRLA